MDELDIPDQCYFCGMFNDTNAQWPTVTVDTDPGDPEVGPDPDICDVPICPACEGAKK